MLPSSFLEAIYQGNKGCVADNADTALVMGGIARNEGVIIFGTNPVIQTPQDGVHTIIAVYNQKFNYGYLLVNKADGKICVTQKLTDYSFKKSEDFVVLIHQKSYSNKDCQFVQHYTKTCGSFRKLSEALISKGFDIDYQAKNEQGHIETFLSGNGKSYRLTTNKDSGATVITGNGTSEFVFHDVPRV